MFNIKSLFTAIIIALCLVSITRVQGFEWEYSEEEAELYRMPIEQITPKDGIWTGHIIAYGHYIKPPYKVEVKDTTVLINNVQIYPALMTPGMIEKGKKAKEIREMKKREIEAFIKAHQEEYNEMQRIDSLAKVLYKKTKTNKGGESALNAVVEFYSKCDEVDSAKVFDATFGEIKVFHRPDAIQAKLQQIQGYQSPYRIVRFEPPLTMIAASYKTKEERDEAMRKMGLPVTKQDFAIANAKIYERSLERGSIKMFFTYGGSSYPGHYFNLILGILQNKFLTLEEKARILPVDLRDASWILYNFDHKEWEN